MKTKIISYNVNGIRAAVKKGFLDWLNECQPDILCLQESKAQNDQVPTEELKQLGYHNFWYSAQKKGYSGVAILCKKQPDHIEYGMGIEEYDNEGRFIRADFGDTSVISVYHPSGSSGDIRQEFKMKWLADFQNYILELSKIRKKLIISGDYNICHCAIDIHDPVRNAKKSGFLPEEREWIGNFMKLGYTDTFRLMHPETKDAYSWWSYRANARANNKGWRIDYHLTSDNIKENIKDAYILPDVKHSDHCPIVVEIDIQ
ncbi:MAG: exodeoxyribonuclease III [Bacteroidales bacterium]